MIRLSGHDRKQLAASIKSDIDAACVQMFSEGHRDHLGASVIGEECNRQIVYGYRWMHREQFDGRMLRLFNRGHLEELRIADWLKGVGITTYGVSKDGEQVQISGVEKHYGGSLDGVLKLPIKYGLDIPFLIEMKTHNQSSFNKLIKNGVKLSKPKHFIQMCCYADIYELAYGVYFGMCKNDDELHVEILEMDWQVGKEHQLKAQHAINATRLPPKIAASPAYQICGWCSMKGVCHLNEPVDVNCRSCANSTPVKNGEWFCKQWNAVIPKSEIPKACGQWSEFK